MRKLAIAVAAIGLSGFFLGCSPARTDQSIADAIKAAMFSDPQAKSANINVVVKNGTATLTGTVPDENTRYEAFKIAKLTPGVLNVQDDMTLPQAAASANPQPPATAASSSGSARAAHASASSRERKPQEQLLVRRPLADSVDESPYGSDAKASPQQTAAPEPSPAPRQTENAAAPTAPAPAAASAPTVAPAAAAAPPVSQATIPGGTPVHIQMIDSVDSAKNHEGDLFHASLSAPIAVDGQYIVPRGADVYVRLVSSSSAGHMTGRSELTLQLARLDFQGKSYNLSSDDYHEIGKSRGTRTAETVGGGAAVGAIIGGILGGGKGAAIGAGVGGGGGAAAQAATKGQQVHIAAETKLDFTLQQPVTVAYSTDKAIDPR